MDAAGDVDMLALRDLRRRQDELLRALTSAAVEEYRLEKSRQSGSDSQYRLEVVRDLLAGKRLSIDLGYDLDLWHVGLIATGEPNVTSKTLESLALHHGCRLLSVPLAAETTWAWLGKRDQSDIPVGEWHGHGKLTSLAMGEPAYGFDGWRSTHHEAQVARQVALHGRTGVVRCVDVLLDAAVLRDETISGALMKTYLTPLDSLRIGGDVARDTVISYLRCQLNVAKTAAVLGVNRKTVENRLRDIEKSLGRPLPRCLAELEVALRLEQKNTSSPTFRSNKSRGHD